MQTMNCNDTIEFKDFNNALYEYVTPNESTQPLINLLKKHNCRENCITLSICKLCSKAIFVTEDLSSENISKFNQSLLLLKHKKIAEKNIKAATGAILIHNLVYQKVFKISPSEANLDPALQFRFKILENIQNLLSLLNKLKSLKISTNKKNYNYKCFQIMINEDTKIRKKFLKALFHSDISVLDNLIMWMIGCLDYFDPEEENGLRLLSHLKMAGQIEGEVFSDELKDSIDLAIFLFRYVRLIQHIGNLLSQIQLESINYYKNTDNLVYSESIFNLITTENKIFKSFGFNNFMQNITENKEWFLRLLLNHDTIDEISSTIKDIFNQEISNTYNDNLIPNDTYRQEFESQNKSFETYQTAWDILPIESIILSGFSTTYQPNEILEEAIKTILNYLENHPNENIDINLNLESASHILASENNLEQFKALILNSIHKQEIDNNCDDTLLHNEPLLTDPLLSALNTETLEAIYTKDPNPSTELPLYKVGNTMLASSHIIHKRVLDWYLPIEDLLDEKNYLTSLTDSQLNWQMISHNFAWALTDIIIQFGIETSYHHPELDQMHKQYTLPVKLSFEGIETSYYLRAILTKDENNTVYHRHLTTQSQDADTENELAEGIEEHLHFPPLISHPLSSHTFKDLSFGDKSYIDLSRSNSNILYIKDPKNNGTFTVPLYNNF